MKYEGTRRAADRNNTGVCDASWYSILREESKIYAFSQRNGSQSDNADNR